jgi:hypothetical protein
MTVVQLSNPISQEAQRARGIIARRGIEIRGDSGRITRFLHGRDFSPLIRQFSDGMDNLIPIALPSGVYFTPGKGDFME